MLETNKIGQHGNAVQKTEKNFFQLISPIIISVFAVYITIGMTLGILPSFVKNDLKQGSLFIGLVIGFQSLATLLTRAYSGKIADTKGAKTANHRGIILLICGSIIYLISTFFVNSIALTLLLVLLARIVHGVAESLSVTGALTWGIGLTGTLKSGKVMTWNGIAMYAGIAIGAPLSLWLGGSFGIKYVFIVMTAISMLSWLATIKLPRIEFDASHRRTPFYKVIGLISSQGIGLAFSSIGFACISSFISLAFNQQNWVNPSMAFVAFGTFYVATRIFFSSYPDRFGGYRVAMISMSIEIIGQLLIGLAPNELIAIIGCGLTGIGFSLIFPALGVLAIKKVEPQMRGTALGAYAAFFDLSLGIAGPIAGVIAGLFNYQSVYFFGAISCFLALTTLLLKKK